MSDPAFLALIALLKNLYFLPKTGNFSVSQVQGALKSYQHIHGLPQSGALDAATCSLLNGNQKIWISTIQEALKNWSLLGLLPVHCVVANIPAFDLEVLDHGRCILHSRVMVGQLNSRTPTFSGHIYSLVFNPKWIVPEHVIRILCPLSIAMVFMLKRAACSNILVQKIIWDRSSF
jgi:murein L,D-transpeptidase YcbB/YkuD